MKKQIFTLSAILLVVAASAIFLLIKFYEDNSSAHFDLQETQLVVNTDYPSSLIIWQSGDMLDFAVQLKSFDSPFWLPPGRYFLEAKQTSQTSFYPIELYGFKSGTEKDGSFAITIRHLALTPPISNYELIPASHFLIGDKLNPEEPHFVWLTSFFINSFETTNREFKHFLESSDGYENEKNWTDSGWKWKTSNRVECSASLQPGMADFERFGQPDQPVTNVSWYEAFAYCNWLTQKYGDRKWLFSLPSEAEWEKSARGPDSFDYGLSMKLSDAESEFYNWKKNPGATETVIGIDQTQKRFRPNRFGLYHMSGNVVEWTKSIFTPYNRKNPYNDYERNNETLSGQRVVRGGSWYSASTALLYLAYRDAFDPGLRHHDLGFRVVVKPIF